MKINGKEIATKLTDKLSLKAKNQNKKVCFVQFGEDEVVSSFVKRKMSLAEKLGVLADVVKLSESLSHAESVDELNEIVGKKYDGIVVQLPLPPQIEKDKLLSLIPKEMDIDLLRPDALNSYENGKAGMVPPVAFAVKSILENCDINFLDKKITILGKGKLVGIPVISFFQKEKCEVASFDITDDPKEIQNYLLKADIIISGIGVPGFIKENMIKEGVILIDAGTSEQAGKIKGDIDPSCYDKSLFYTPVPGGVGPIAVVGLFNNLFKS